VDRYRAASAHQEHERCAFCWTKFMDPDFSADHHRFVSEHAEVLIAGYTTTQVHPSGAKSHWVCETCMDDFADEFAWSVAAR